MPLPFNKNLDLKLLELVKDNPILYNTKHSKYLDFDSREVVWQKIGDALTRPAVEFAGIQCQIHFEDFQEDKHKPGFIENLNEFLPVTYSSSWGVEKKVLKAYRKHLGLSHLEAKNLYIKTARDLPTYGVTFFLVKEKQKDKKKLVPRLLGINAQAILRMDENTKEILQQWPLTHVKSYHVGKSETFTLNFGDYSDKEYCCKTQDVHRIRDILEGYIDLIRRRMFAKPSNDTGDSMAICHDHVEAGQSNIIQHIHNPANKLFTETFVGPSRIITHEQGSTAQQGTQVMTMQQIIASNQFNNPQKALKGEVAQRGDMSIDCVRKLKRMNSSSVKVVTLLAEPTEANVSDSQKLTKNMQEDLVVVEMGMKAIAQQQTIEESRQMLLNEMQDLNNYMNKLSENVKPGHVDPNEAKDAAEKIVDLTTEMYLAQDPKTKRRSELLNRSKKSFIAGEKMDASIRRASFLTAASSALGGVEQATATLAEEYKGPPLDESRKRNAELALQDRIGKLNAALALYLTAHSDPNNIDYPAAINSMNTIDELMADLAKEGQMLASTKAPQERKDLLDDMRALFDNTRNLCSLTGSNDHAKMQEASSKYADVAGKLIFKIGRGGNSQKENEIIELAKAAGDKTTLLLMSANELTAHAPAEPAAALDNAGVRSAAAAMDLLACAQLTAPAIYEPHCRSALTAATEGLSSSVHHLSATWKPLVEDPSRQQLSDQLHHREMDVHLALEKLRNAYANLGDLEDESVPLEERQRLKFIFSLSGARDGLKGLTHTWGKSGAESPSVEPPAGPKGVMMLELKEKAASRRLAQQLAELNAAVARLTSATSDPEKQDFVTAESALNTIAELLPTIVHDADVASARQDEGTRAAMKQHITGLCEASQHMFDTLSSLDDLGPPAAKFSSACSKLVFLTSPGADKGKEKMINELASAAYDSSAALLAQTHQRAESLGAERAAGLRAAAARAEHAARALVTVAQVTAPSVTDASCSSALASALQHLQNCTNEVTAMCYLDMKPGSKECKELQHSQQQLENNLEKLAQLCQLDLSDKDIEMGEPSDLAALSPQREKKRLQFIKSMADAQKRLDAAEQQMKEPLACVMMRAEDAASLQRQLGDKLARLNAAVAALARAAADGENPDYEAAQRAIDTITELMPELVQETCVLGATKSGDTQHSMLQQLQRLCRAARALCTPAPPDTGLTEATAAYSDASRKLVFLVSAGADHGKEKQIIDLTTAACGHASELLSHVQGLRQEVPVEEGAELEKQEARTTAAAQALLTTAQVTAATIASPLCSSALVSAAEQLRSSAKDLTSGCQTHLKAGGHQEPLRLQNSEQQLENSLDKLIQACKETPRRKPPAPPQQDKHRLHFVNSLSGAKSCFDDVQQQLYKPVVCALMREEDGVALEHQLSDRLAQLNAAIAALATATADREHPDYASAQRAVDTITALMPQLVRESRTLSGTRSGDAQQSMLQQVQQLCDASRAVCDSAGQPQALSEAAAKFSDASCKLRFTITPAPDQDRETQIINLSSDACGRASDLLSRVQSLTQRVPEKEGIELDKQGARTADAAQALLTSAQVTAPMIASPHCSAALISAVEQLRSSAKNLTTTCQPHLKPGDQEQLELQGSEQQLEDSLDKLVQACKETPRRKPPVPPQQDKQRLHFVNSLSGAKSCFDDVQQQLQQPVVCALMREEDGAALQHKLSDRLAELNAAIAALTAATADREHPDYAAAQRAVDTITALMPELVRDSKTLSGTRTGDAQQSLLQQVQQLCDASRAVCDSAGQPQALSEAAAKFSDASGQLMFTYSPAPDQGKEKKIMDLSVASCKRASELLSQVQALSGQLHADVAGDLDSRGALTADAAQAMLAIAQVTASSMSSPRCQAALESAVQRLRRSATDLTDACSPHAKQGHQRKQLLDTHRHLDDSLDRLLQASGVPVVLSPEQQEKRRLTFINSLTAAKSCFADVQQQLQQPVVGAALPQEQARALQHQLSDRLAQLNAAIANLAAATADREHPDYASAQLAVHTISALMPQLVRDARTLSATHQGPAQQSLLQQVQQLCDASRAVCDSAGQPQGLSEAAAKFSEASSQLTSSVIPAAGQGTQQQILDLAEVSCVHASELLFQVQALTQQIEGTAAIDLDRRGAKAADAAQALLSVARVTAPSMSSQQCRLALESVVQRLRGSAADLTSACDPHVNQAPQRQQLLDTHQHLDDCLDLLLRASGVPVVLSPEQQEKRRLTFINSLAGAKNGFADVQQQLEQPVVGAALPQEQARALQHQLSDRLAQLNAAIANLAAATADRKHPDYACAQRAVNTITALMPELVRDAKTLSATKQGPAQQNMLQQVQQLCEASKAVCDSAGQSQGLSEAAVKFSEASSKLTSSVAPATSQQTQKQIIDLSAASCVRASDLLSQVQALTEQIGGSAAADLDRRGAKTADAAQGLLSVAQVIAPSVSSPQCRAALGSAVQRLRGTAAELTGACDPHVKQGPQRQQLLDTHQHLDDSLDMLLQTSGVPVVLSPEQQEKRRLTFINSLAGAKNGFTDVQQQLEQPVVGAALPQEQARALQHQLSDRLAQLNAAIANLAAATADREHPDYASAQRAVNTITTLMPELVRDARSLSATQQGPAQESMLQQVQQLCDASRAICEGAGQPQGLSEAAVKFSEASSKLASSVTPAAGQGTQQQIKALSAAASGRASELRSQVQELAQQIDGSAATDMVRRGAKTTDAAQALLSVVQVTAPSMSSPQCKAAIKSAVQRLRGSAADLTGACDPHMKQGPQRQQLLDTHQHLTNTLDMLLDTTGVPVVLSPEQQEKRRLTFINSLAGVKSCFADVEKQLKQPVVGAALPQEQARALQHQLSDRLAQLNAAIARLTAATADRERPNYASAEQAVSTVIDLMPQLVRDVKTLSATQQGPAQESMLQQVQQLCDASRAVCDSAGQPQGSSKAATQFSEVSSHMMSTLSLVDDRGKEQLIIDLSAASCSRAAELLSHAQALSGLLRSDGAGDLDSHRARTSDAAQALLAVAQVTAPSISSPDCQLVLESAVQTLRESASELASTCEPHLKPGSERQQVLDAHQHLNDSLDILLQASGPGDVRSPALQETLRVKFIRSVSTISPQVKDAEKLLKEPPSCPPMEQSEKTALQHQLGRRLGQLNAAVAALTAATTDHKYPDYAAAERSIITITEHMPKVVQESKILSYSKSDDAQQMIHQNLKELCDASRKIIDNADDPKKLNESAAKFAFTSGKLVLLVAPGDGDMGKRKGPAVPQRSAQIPGRYTVAHAVPSRKSGLCQDFLDAMRSEEDSENAARVVAEEATWAATLQTDEEKCRHRQFSNTVDSVEDDIKYVEDTLKKLHNAKPRAIDALEVVRREQRAEEALARAGVEVAALVSANYADKLDYSAAQEPTLGLGNTLRAIVEDGSAISGALPEESRKPFIDDMSRLCGATRNLCQAARDEKERLNDAAIAFGNHSARLLHVVSAHVNPALEKEVIVRARAIGDCASRLALEATNVANMLDNKSGEHVQSICTAGAQCVDAAGKLVYTAKLVAPTIHHTTCQEALTSSADTLASNLKTFSDTWQPFASDPHTQKLTAESSNLTKLLKTLKADVESGRLGKRREVERLVVVDTPLRKMTVQIIDNARSLFIAEIQKDTGQPETTVRHLLSSLHTSQASSTVIKPFMQANMAEHGDLPPEAKKEYKNYCDRLTEAVQALDYSNARCQRAPHDTNRRNEMEIAIQDLQMMLLQSRPAKAGQEQNNIVDFRDFLQGLVTESDNLARTVDKNKAITGKRTADDMKVLCSKISEDATRLMSPSQNAGYEGFDDIMEFDEFGQECDVLVKELNSLVRSVPEPKARSTLLAKLYPLTENCNLLRFATNSALSTAESAAYDAALHDLDDFQSTFIRALADHRLQKNKEARGGAWGARGAWGVLRAALALLGAAGRPQALRRALSSYAMRAHAAERARSLAERADVCVLSDVSEVESSLCEDMEKLNKEINALSAGSLFMSRPEECADKSLIERAIKPKSKSLQVEDIEKLMVCSSNEVEGGRDESEELTVFQHLEVMAREVKESTETSALLAANWLKPDRSASTNLIKKVSYNIKGINKEPNSSKSKSEIEVLKEEDIEKLLSCQGHEVEGTRSQLEDKLHRLSTKLSSMSGSIFQSVRTPASAARSLHATAAAATELAATARAHRDDKRPAYSKKIEDAVHEMCLATFSLMKISELLCQNPDHHDTRRRLLDACYHLNDSINKLNRTIHPEPTIARECNELLSVLQLQRSVLQSAPQPAASSPYAHCIDALQSQRDVLLKLNSDEAMSREEFLKSMLFITTAVTNSTECAAQATYLLSVSENDKTVALEGIMDIPKMQKTIAAIHDTCVGVTMNPMDQVAEEKKVIEKQIEELLIDLDESIEKTKNEELKTTLVMCKKEILVSAKSFYKVVNENKPAEVIISVVLSLDEDVQQLSGALEHPALVPAGGALASAGQALCDDVLKHSTALVSDTQELIKDIKNFPEQSDVMKWSSFSKRKEVLNAIDALIKSIKTNGQNINILEADFDESEQKSYVQIQTETAFKWLHKPMAKSDVKANGQQAVKNLIEVGKKMTEDLAGADKEDLRHVVEETEQLLTHCCKKYDQDQYSLLMERIRELQKALERMAVTRVVEDFMDAEEPLADLDILADAERDAKKRKFLLEQKIAELLAQLGRVKRTASYIANTGSIGPKVSTELRTCSEQTELLAPLLVKAAEQRIHKSDDQVVIENYKALLARYTESLSKVRDLCDQSVDPMDFVQTAGETMQRMRDESINQDIMKCAYTSSAITKLANRVIHVGLSSSSARADPELQRALGAAQRQLSAATPAPDTRASKMPDWKDTTALILRATGEVESVLGGENIFNKQPDTNEPIYNEALNLHVAIRDWSSRDNEIVAVAKRMAVLMAKLSAYMHTDKQREVLTTSKSIVSESREVARLARKLAHECPDHRIKTNLLQVCDRIPTISGQLKMLTTIKGSSLGHHGTQEDKEAMDMLVGNAQSLMISIQDVVKAAASASVKIMSQRGPKIKWVRKTYY